MFLNKVKQFIEKHYLALIFTVIVGLIYVAPHLFFITSLGDDYKGIPMMATANEDAYLFRMQEIIDEHYLIGSPVYYEYKNEWPMAPPIGEMFYAILSMITGVSLVNIVIISRFILPLILFLLIYFLIFELSQNSKNCLSKKINAITGSLFITLGYDLVDYRTLWLFLTGKIEFGERFLLWARPVNPILGAIFLFSFLLCLWFIIKKSKCKKMLVITASIFLSLMIGSYFFSWGLALSVLGVLILMYFLKKEYKIVKNLLSIIFITAFLTLPFWYMSFQASKSPWYELSVLRNGLFHTHQPLLNKVLLAALLFYFILFIPVFLKKIKLILKDKILFRSQFNFSNLENWHVFCLALLLGGLWALNQQIITGITIWPYHFVQYTIPFAIITVLVLIHNIIRDKNKYFWGLIVTIIIISSLVFGIYTQKNAYDKNFNYYSDLQEYKKIFNWLNNKEKDCVVLVKESKPERYGLNGLIPAFTHCNIYASEQTYSLMPYERSYFNYLVKLRLKGVQSKNIEEYMKKNRREAETYLFSNWKGLLGIKEFSDVSDSLLEERIKKFPQDYQEFMKNDFKQELKKYRLDYILSEDLINEELLNQLPNLELVYKNKDLFIYSFN